MIEMMLGGGKRPTPKGNIVKFEAQSAGIAALSASGKLYVIGDQYISGAGAGNSVTTWTLLADGVETFAMGYRSTIIKMKDGRWLFLGTNNMFPTGLGTNVFTLTDVTPYMQYPEGLVVSSVAIGFASLAVVFTNGQYAMCGRNGFGGLGVGNTTNVRTLTMRTDFTDVRKVDFDKGALDTSYMIRNNGYMYACGASDSGQTGVISTAQALWKLQPNVGKDFYPGYSGWFFTVDTGTLYLTYAQGRQFDGSLGTGSVAATNYTTPQAVFQNVRDRTQIPVIHVGLYSARVTNPDTGVLYYTGTSSGAIQGSGVTQSVRYAFTALPAATLQGEYHALRSSYTASYLLINGTLFGTGQDSGGLGFLPGLGTTRSNVYVELDTTAVT
jgi:Alpha-tubulin suppressor and related RCC1 domain-containing proteins